MEAHLNAIDSAVLGVPVLEISDFDSTTDFAAFEAEYVRTHSPAYVVIKLPVEEVAEIHRLEEYGFRFLEVQFRLSGTPGTHREGTEDYSYLPVESEQDLEEVLAIAGSIFKHERFSRDPYLVKIADANAAGERYRRYVQKSLAAADECVYKLVNNKTGEIAGFGTHRIRPDGSALLLIGGVKEQYQQSGLGVINDYLGLNELRRKGVKRFHTHISASNYSSLNLEVRHLGFRVLQAFAVLRKTHVRS